MGVCERGVNERPRSAETPPKTKTTEIMARLEKTMLANTCRRLRSRIGSVMEAGVNLMGRTGCRYTKEHLCKISRQFIHFHRSYGSFCKVKTFVLIYRPHPVFLALGQYFTQLWQVKGQIFANSMIFQLHESMAAKISIVAA